MSSTIKRIALVAVAALGLGSVSAISANATAPAASTDTGAIVVTVAASNAGTAYSAPTATQVAGANNYVAFTVYAPAAPLAIAVTGGVATTADTATTGSGTANLLTTKGSAAAVTYNVPTTAAGTITVKTYEFSSGAQLATSTSSLTITVLAAAAGTVYNHSVVAIQQLTTPGSNQADIFVDGTLTGSASTANGNSVAQLTVSQFSTVDTTTAMVDASATAVTVAVSGAGTVGTSAANRGPSVTVAAATASSHGSSGSATGTQTFYIYADGRSGVSTITVTVNGVVASTKSYTFSGTTVSSYKAQSDSTAGNVLKKIIAVGATSTQDILGYDSNGNKVVAGAGTIYAVSADTSIATVSVSGQTITVTGVKSGTTNVTVCDTSSCTAAVKTLVVPVSVAKSTAASFKASFDQSSYAPGDAMTVTLTVKDADGNLVADGNYSLISGTNKYSKSFQSSSAVDALVGSIAVKGGVATATAYAPASEGDFTITYTDAIAAADVTITSSVSGSTSAALDAANEATDAANAATDAANAAAEAADAATAAAQDAQAAVAALATQVASLIAGIKAQITTLTNLVIKIQKKVKA